MREYILQVNELSTIFKELSLSLPNGGVIILRGDLAAGKTTLVSAFAKEFGVNEVVTSPTFSLQQRYGENIFHYDIYNHGLEHFLALGMLEELERDGYHFIEWGTRELVEILQYAEIPVLLIDIEKLDEKRLYRIEDAYAKS
jgi:tRNA threonylcarbamoyladenosine biosynthesis protein TsaE